MANEEKTGAIQTDAGEEKKNDQLASLFALQQAPIDEDVLVEMTKAGVVYGHKKSRKNPRFSEYVFSVRNGIELIDITKTLHAIEIVAQFLKKNKAEGKNILIVGTQAAAREGVEKLSVALGNCPFVVDKWIGGLITNFSVLSKRLDYFKRQKKGLAEGAFAKYTKRERLLMEREISKMENKFKGLEDFKGVPDIMFVIDSSVRGHKTALHEAKVKKIQVVGIIDNDDDPTSFSFFIPANDHSLSSINWVITRLVAQLSK
ncbi:MAG: 30S ribosomal protein S2 [Candidatus Paceibacterota bacterium]